MRNMPWPDVIACAHAAADARRGRTRLADAPCVLAWFRGTAALERERRVTLVAALRLIRPGLWISDRDESGRERVIAHCPGHQPVCALAKVTR